MRTLMTPTSKETETEMDRFGGRGNSFAGSSLSETVVVLQKIIGEVSECRQSSD